jgi:hypothetical protein
MRNDLVVVRTFSSELEAEMARVHLEAAGIQALVLKDDAGGMEPPLQLTRGVRLLVHAGDRERARDLLAEGGR